MSQTIEGVLIKLTSEEVERAVRVHVETKGVSMSRYQIETVFSAVPMSVFLKIRPGQEKGKE